METRCRVLRIEPPTPDSVERIVPGAVRAYEDRFAATIHGRLAPEVRARLDALLQPVSGQLDDGEDEPSTPGARALLNFVRGDPGRASLDSVMRELERLQTTDKGMIVRNDAGAEGLVAWRKIQALADGPVRLTYGYAMTVDTAQGSTATEHIHAMSAGSHAIHSFKAYTAASRHQRTTWMVVDEASERRHLVSRSMLGHRREVREPDLWRNIGENLSRQPEKASALAMLHRTAETPRQMQRRI